MKKISLLFLTVLLIISCKNKPAEKEATAKETLKIVSLNGAITETIAALGKGDNIVGRDVTSSFPDNLKAKDLGHVRSLTIEPILEVSPNLILASNKDVNPDLNAKIEASKIKTQFINQTFSVVGAKKLIENVANAIGVENYTSLQENITKDIAKLTPIEKKPKVLFIYARGQMLMVAGTNTPMEALINIAGGENAITEFENFKPLTPESLIEINPDAILMFNSGLKSAGGIDAMLQVSGMLQTQAGKNKRILTMDGGLISNFGPRIGKAALELNKLLIESAQ
ncbi:iron complex transport system substrate-binding protein [Mesonia hippocampi]|uniref:Iron complex transport system substrate-binding protein n=1 Tax=Mesonia hippocampi TaxID=1628250 RepID=A0A840EVE5_9FLAO|nr:ABC transporter substrate-binding protein [Mesonia hippocampi]MBB4118837.1 iron complex transport system substrate-binding protein [Mesonia hippocampi]